MKKLVHLPLERYKQRYTEFLHDWEIAAFSQLFSQIVTLTPDDGNSVSVIKQGKVLDSFNRPLWALEQIKMLLSSQNAVGAQAIYFSDFFHPGLEAIPYSEKFKPDFTKTGAFCWAQSFDQFDFTTKFIPWIRKWEYFALTYYDYIFVASSLLADLIITAAPAVKDKIIVHGLPFDSNKVLTTAKKRSDSYDVAYTSRWDKEKNPGVFVELVRENKDLSFVVCTGSPQLVGDDIEAIKMIRHLASIRKNVVILEGLDKANYYGVLNETHVQFNCALQDWVSFTLLEALTMGCMPLYPNFRSFPEALHYQDEYLYEPMNISSATKKLRALLDKRHVPPIREAILGHHDSTLKIITEVMYG